MVIWLTGSKGMLGAEIYRLLEEAGLPFTGTDREVDITDPAELADFVNKQVQPFAWIINCAAYTAVDKAEDDRNNCSLLNSAGAGNIAHVANKAGAGLIHLSTDYVFNGKGNRPYTEEDDTDPIGVYGLTKRNGEIQVLEKNPRSYIIRTAWLYGRHGNNFVYTMLRLMKEREYISVVNDQWGSPTWTCDLARVIITLISLTEAGSAIPCGIYHFTNEGEITWYDFAKEIYAQSCVLGILTKNCEIKPCTSTEFPAKVKRPGYSVLDKSRIKALLGIDVSAWNTSLKEFLKSYDYPNS